MAETPLPSLIQQMMEPGFYPHPVPEPVQLIQTHISYVLLAGEYAYKVKKPMDFGFLNFTTLDLRRHFCEEELRMNRRGAPGIYLEVLPITQQGDQFLLRGAGEAVEYTLKMKQFPQDRLLSSLFERGELTVELMEKLGRAVAEFHSKTETNEHIRSYGPAERVREAFDENYQQTEAYIGGPQTQQQFEETKAYTDQFFAERADLFQQRIDQDKIRECHGDLHLRNICYWRDQLLLFDCIEFNEPFRFVDTLYDIAYAVMDLDTRQRSDLANTYLNTYLEETGDWEGLLVLPIYLNRQAYVRAKVGSFLLSDPGAPAAVKAEAEKTAANYYRLAWEYTRPRQGKVILMSGISGSGKSTVARQLARQINAIHIRSDAVRKHLAGISIHERGGNEIYTPEMSEKTYERLQQLGIRLAQAGYPVILDAKYDRQAPRLAVIQAAQQHPLPIQILHCTAPMEILQERVEQRTAARAGEANQATPDIADATPDLLASQHQQWEDFTTTEQTLVIPIDTTREWQTQMSEI